MHHDDIALMEHLAAQSALSLQAFCEIARDVLALPAFEYDAENETEWAVAVKEGVEYNISRPYAAGALQRWDATVPKHSNFGIILIFSKRAAVPSLNPAVLVTNVGQALATALGVPIAYHRTWLSVGSSVPRQTTFLPQSSDA